ncbi:helix-turn-helix domain-containing protein [uncultured Jatrophihabitans sp.]|uniref:helix-turn-helix domain-containing protein n=1 Tax=uncultured Jatrophihabitans sp. TaxID=1610747 RepID=UPI0035CBD831
MPRNPVPQSAAQEQVRVGATLKVLREKSGLKPDEAANRVPISRSYLVNIEAGRKPLTPVLCARFAAIYNAPQAAIVPEGYFLNEPTEVPA